MSAPHSGQPRAEVKRPQPLVRWAGSKRQILPRLESYWRPSYDRYIEPFCGSSALFYEIQPQSALLSDTNAELINFYEIVRTDPVSVWTTVSRYTRTLEYYNAVRCQDPKYLSAFERATRFLFLNRNCFNGLYRTNRSGEFNVPFSASRTGALPDLQHFLAAAKVLSQAQLRCYDFGHALRNAVKGDFVYLDPPYFVTTRRMFRHYGPRGFHREDMSRLDRHLSRLDAKGAHFVLSLADSKESRLLGKAWTMQRIRVRRQIAGFAAARRNAYELVISNITRSVGSDDD